MDGKQIDLQAKARYGYALELGRNNIKYNAPVEIELPNLRVPFFKRYMLSSGECTSIYNGHFLMPKIEHYNYMRDIETLGPCIVSLGGYRSGKQTKAMIRTKYVSRIFREISGKIEMCRDVIVFICQLILVLLRTN
jgi:hypothetical protein